MNDKDPFENEYGEAFIRQIHWIETLLLFSFRGFAGSRVRLLDTKMRLKIDTLLEILFHDNDLGAVCQVQVPVFTFLWELSQCRRQGFYPLLYFKRWRYLFCLPNGASIVMFWHFKFYSVWPGQCWFLTLREEDVADDLPDLQLAKNTGRFLASPRVFLDAASSERNWFIHSNSQRKWCKGKVGSRSLLSFFIRSVSVLSVARHGMFHLSNFGSFQAYILWQYGHSQSILWFHITEDP